MGAIQNKLEGPVSDELTLVRAAKQGDDSAFEELVRRYDRNVFRIAQHITQNREDAEDVVQEAFLKAYGNLAEVPGAVEILYLAGAHRRQRSVDEVAPQEARAHGFAGRRHQDGRRFASARDCGLESESGAAVHAGRIARDFK
jgi:hypothetical protein